MATDGDILLRMIIDHPDDDLVRLVYADWLEENGQPERAEFIRLKINLEAETGQSREGMEQRAREIWKQWRSEWLAQLPQGNGLDWGPNWARGFPEQLTFDTADAFHRLAAPAFAAAPVRKLSIAGLETDTAVTILFSPLVARLVAIDFLYSSIGNMGVQFLMASEHVRQLRHLNLSSNSLSDHAALAIAEKDSLPALEVLVLSHNHITDDGAGALARSRWLGKLDRLYVNANQLSEVGIEVLQKRFRRVIS